MQDCFIRLQDLHVSYPSRMYNSLSLKEYVFGLLRLQPPRVRLHDVHALRGLNFEIQAGERVGIIGRNGAGKSTLLRAIAGIYPVQSGTIETSGVVRALFELNLGFEIDATGRQNIIYRGLLQGETPASIKAKEQEIVEFAELGEFIDYPIKTYSAGMLVRLAFAISTCSEADILLLDEIVGAGDAAFFKKARQRIRQLVAASKIMLLVSHDLTSIGELCTRVIHIEHGQVVRDGPPEEVIDDYLSGVTAG